LLLENNLNYLIGLSSVFNPLEIWERNRKSFGLRARKSFDLVSKEDLKTSESLFVNEKEENLCGKKRKNLSQNGWSSLS
jgi:hypothetical protein